MGAGASVGENKPSVPVENDDSKITPFVGALLVLIVIFALATPVAVLLQVDFAKASTTDQVDNGGNGVPLAILDTPAAPATTQSASAPAR